MTEDGERGSERTQQGRMPEWSRKYGTKRSVLDEAVFTANLYIMIDCKIGNYENS